ncbi:MAG: basic amino acid/polyamine antiporter, family [Acidobacteriaceae bacterium]|jgi:APA family basic amino acid/polyamine antiporter
MAIASSRPGDAPRTLVRTLRLRDLELLIVGAIIGSGIFVVPGAILRQVDYSVGLAAAIWVAGGVLSWLGAMTYAELAAAKPESGGLYVYIRDCFGPFSAFLYGWSIFAAISSGTVASLAVAFSNYLATVIPLNFWEAKLVSVCVIVVVTTVNVLGTRSGAGLQNWTTAIKLLMTIGICVVLLLLGREYSAIPGALWTSTVSGSMFSKFGLAMVSVLWAYEGWQFVTYTAGETLEPQKNFPRALFSSVLFVSALYILANLGYLAALGPEKAGRSETIAASAFAIVLGPAAAKIIALTILISVFSAINSVLLTAPRVLYAMASDGLFLRKLSRVHPRFRTPAYAIVAMGAWSAILSCMGGFQQLIKYTMFVAWIFYGLGAASIFLYRRKYPTLERAYRVPGYPWTPIVFVAAAAALVLNVIFSTPRDAAIGLGMVAMGMPAYIVWRARKQQSTDS